MGKFMNPFTDVGFKHLFGRGGQQGVAIGIVASHLG